MERQRLFLGINVANSLLWTFLTAVLATGKSPVSWPVIHVNSYEAAHNAQNDDSTEDLGWPAYGTMAWLAFVYACLAAFSFWKDPRMINVATNACLLCLFSGLVIALVAPAYAGHWKGKFRIRMHKYVDCFLDIENPRNWMKMHICTIVFSAFSIVGGYALNSHVVGLLAKANCQSATVEAS